MNQQNPRRPGTFGALRSRRTAGGRRVPRIWASVLSFETTPHAVGLGLATGVFVAFLPVLGVQMLMAMAIAWAGRANVGAAVLGTWAGNPLTWPAMWVGSYLLGIMLLGEAGAMTVDEVQRTLVRLAEAPASRADPLTMLDTLSRFLWPILKPLFVGSLVLGLISGAALYFIGRRAAEVFSIRRQQ
ncbi:MAG: DUF2062 domain-containing protein [Hyphomicrobiaceae bacterium]